MKSSAKKQRGLTFISLVFVLAFIAFVVLLVLKIVPLYLNNSKVANAVAAVRQQPDIVTKSKQEILNSLQKRFDLNYVEKVTPDDIEIIAQPGYVKLDIKYERVEPIAGNLSILVQFHEGFEVGSR